MNDKTIASTCFEEFSNITLTETGAFCARCNEKVVDFTHSKKDDVFKILSSRKRHPKLENIRNKDLYFEERQKSLYLFRNLLSEIFTPLVHNVKAKTMNIISIHTDGDPIKSI